MGGSQGYLYMSTEVSPINILSDHPVGVRVGLTF